MEQPKVATKSNVKIQLPIKIDYGVLDEYLQKKLQGKVLSKGKANGESSDHAKIQKINLGKSPLEDYDLAVNLQLQLLTTLFRNKEIKAVVHLSLDFREAYQEVHIPKYRLDGENNSWVTNGIVEMIINNFLYSKLKEKMKFDLKPIIAQRLEKLNLELAAGKEIVDGINLTGKLSEFWVEELIPGQRTLLVSVRVLGNNVLNVRNIDL